MNVLTENSSITFGPEERRFVYSVARRIVQSDEDADDVAQDALLLAHLHLGDFRGESRFRTWLYRIATTTALGHLRRTKRAKAHVPATEIPLVDPAQSAEAKIADEEMSALVRDAVAKLEPQYRDVIVARAQGNDAEVASNLGISRPNVKIRAHRARKKLRAILEQTLGIGVGVAA